MLVLIVPISRILIEGRLRLLSWGAPAETSSRPSSNVRMPSLICFGAGSGPFRIVFVIVRMILGAKIMSKSSKTNTNIYKKDWVLTENSWHQLLQCLDPDPNQAGIQYEKIREKLIKLFEWRNFHHPEELADRTINRVARKIEEGLEILSKDRYAYFYKVACMVAKEEYRGQKRKSQALVEHAQQEHRQSAAAQDEADERLSCLRQCIAALPPEQRDLILKYHATESSDRIPHRQQMAQRLEIPLNALRIRVCRIRTKLEDCIEKCYRRAQETTT